MSHHDAPPPALLPVLSRGKHRNPRKGACFMEFASLLAGERWSDHPACTAFAPTNDAFGALPKPTLDKVLGDPRAC